MNNNMLLMALPMNNFNNNCNGGTCFNMNGGGSSPLFAFGNENGMCMFMPGQNGQNNECQNNQNQNPLQKMIQDIVNQILGKNQNNKNKQCNSNGGGGCNGGSCNKGKDKNPMQQLMDAAKKLMGKKNKKQNPMQQFMQNIIKQFLGGGNTCQNNNNNNNQNSSMFMMMIPNS